MVVASCLSTICSLAYIVYNVFLLLRELHAEKSLNEIKKIKARLLTNSVYAICSFVSSLSVMFIGIGLFSLKLSEENLHSSFVLMSIGLFALMLLLFILDSSNGRGDNYTLLIPRDDLMSTIVRRNATDETIEEENIINSDLQSQQDQ